MEPEENTQIGVKKETRLKLHMIKEPGMTYNDVIERLLVLRSNDNQ
jgi:hypothetical protein